jgi:gliding motility-associated-like protein
MYRNFKSILLFSILLFLGPVAFGQLTVDEGISAEEALEILLGDGLEVSNVTYNGGPAQIGSFECVDCGIGMEAGVILASGGVSGAIGPNDSGSETVIANNPGNSDSDIEQIESSAGDIAVLEFDFTATGDSLSFNFVWASEEYPEFVNSFNDAFAFFLSGPGLNGPYSNNGENIAQIPGTNMAVTIDNLNNGSNGTNGPCVNCEYYVNNLDNSDPNGIQYDGYTTLLPANAQLQCGETYHIKIVIADALDTAYDSAVFLEAGSFESNATFIEGSGNINPDQPNFLGDTTLIEGCNTGSFSVFRPVADDSTTIFFEILGTAENGVDITEIPPFVFLDSGEQSIEIQIDAIEDGMDEGTESIILQYVYQNSCGDFDTTSASLAIVDYIEPVLELQGSGVACPNDPTTLTANVIEGMGTYFYNWTTGDTTAVIQVLPDTTTQYLVEVTDLCGTVVQDSISVSVDYTPMELSPEEFSVLCPGGSTEITVNPNMGAPSYTYDWANIELPDTSVVTVFPQDQEFTEYDVTITDQCDETISTTVTVFLENYDIQPIVASPDTLCAGTNGSVQPISGGTGTYTFGTDVEGINLNQDGTFGTSSSLSDTLDIAITDECGNFSVVEVVVEICDTSIPNIITPNDDNKNDIFTIEGLEGFQGSYLLIKNRWGVTVFESSDYKNDWDGTTSSGEDVKEGTYYYIFQRSDGEGFSGYLQISR